MTNFVNFISLRIHVIIFKIIQLLYMLKNSEAREWLKETKSNIILWAILKFLVLSEISTEGP